MSVEGYKIRQARTTDLEVLPEIEREAASLFTSRASELGLSVDGPGEVNSPETFAKAQALGRVWVATDSSDKPVGFALVLEIDGLAHLEEMDVLPAHGRRGLGSALLEAVCRWAEEDGYPAITLSTFRDVPWNGPFYRRHKFRVLDRSELSPVQLRLVDHEQARGLRTDLRAVMRRDLRREAK